jgi:hypothetical protein
MKRNEIFVDDYRFRYVFEIPNSFVEAILRRCACYNFGFAEACFKDVAETQEKIKIE